MTLIALAILSYCLWNGSDLFSAWRGSPFERESWMLLLLWSTPLIIYHSFHQIRSLKDRLYHPVLLWGALATSFVGLIGSLNVLQHMAIALSLAAFIPWSWELIPWLGAAIVWVPAFSWIGARFTPQQLLFIRFIIIFFSLCIWLWGRTVSIKESK